MAGKIGESAVAGMLGQLLSDLGAKCQCENCKARRKRDEEYKAAVEACGMAKPLPTREQLLETVLYTDRQLPIDWLEGNTGNGFVEQVMRHYGQAAYMMNEAVAFALANHSPNMLEGLNAAVGKWFDYHMLPAAAEHVQKKFAQWATKKEAAKT